MPSHDEIAQRAYDIYAADGYQQGRCRQYWEQAEHDLKEQSANEFLDASYDADDNCEIVTQASSDEVRSIEREADSTRASSRLRTHSKQGDIV